MTGQYTGYDCHLVCPPEDDDWMYIFGDALMAVESFCDEPPSLEDAINEIEELMRDLDSAHAALIRYENGDRR